MPMAKVRTAALMALRHIAPVVWLTGCAAVLPVADHAGSVRDVTDRERAFAQTMKDRNYTAFADFVAEEAVFFSGEKPLRGRTAITQAWQRFYTAKEAPFSWAPDAVEVLDSGALALSTGPVRNAQGKVIARFNSIWRKEPDGVWRVVFDRGTEVCDCAQPR